MFIPGGSAIPTSGYDINNSLRFRSSASAWLNRTFTSAGNRKIWTFSAWVKRGQLGTAQMILCGYSGSSTELTNLQFNSNDTLEYYYDNGATNYRFTTSQVFRDPSAWYHIVLAVDTTQATNTNRAKLYVNGSQVTAFSTYETFPQNSDTFVNGAWGHGIGKYIYPGQTRYVDGYLAEVNFVNAQQLTPSSFGATDAVTGVWAPKAYTGTYGTNGFYLKFSDIATTSGSNAGLGKDFSGNGNYWTTNNISVTAGTTYDAMTDSPTLTSATVANYAVLSPIDNYNMTLSSANLTFATTSGASYVSRSTISMTSGKWYWEVTPSTTGTNVPMIGITSSTTPIANAGYNGTTDTYYYWGYNGQKYSNGGTATYGATFTSGDIIGVALDMDNGTLTFYKNNVSQGTAYTGLTGKALSASVTDPGGLSAIGGSINFGQRPFTYTPPTGFNRLNAYNLPDSTIKKGNSYMDATLWTGNGSAQTITNAGAFKPDLVWWKNRNSTRNNLVFDSIRGVGNYIQTNTTNAEATDAQMLTSFNSNGFTHGTAANGATNAETYVGWQWQAGQGTTSSNTAGSITSTTSVSATAGFSVVTYTGNGSAGATVGHGLGVAPKMIIVKPRNAVNNWSVYHESLGNTKAIYLDLTNASASSPGSWNNTSPTSSVITLGNSAGTNGSAVNLVAYAWAEIAGFSKFGSYTGNGSADGTFVYLGFMPKYIMIKSSSIAGEWAIYDTPRDLYNPMGLGGGRLQANTSNAETAADSAQYIDFLSNGFKIRNISGFDNQSSATYIYAAFASNPFKNSNAF